MYTIDGLAKLANISKRTLRFYDEKGLLQAKRKPASNYRYYDESDVDRLQEILILRSMRFSLDQIKTMMDHNMANAKVVAYEHHLDRLNKEKENLDARIELIKNTLKYLKGDITMNNEDKFKGIIEDDLKVNDKLYKDEIISKYNKSIYEQSRKQFKNMSQEMYQSFLNLSDRIISKLLELYHNPSETLEKAVYKLHKQFIETAWGYYDSKAHLGLVDMYVEDERFKAYYDQHQSGLAQLLRDVVYKHIQNNN